MNKFFNKIERYLNQPIIENFPFFVIFSVLLLPHVTTGFINDGLNRFSINSFADALSMFVFNGSEVLALAYLFCLVLFLKKSTILKVLFYTFVLLVFGINLYLRFCFGTLFSSKILLLIAETNPREVSEFFLYFALRPISAIIILGILFIGLFILMVEKWYHTQKKVLMSNTGRIVFASCVFFILFISIIETTRYANSFRNQTFSSYDNLLQESKYSRMDYCRKMINELFFFYLSGGEQKKAIAITEKVITDNYGMSENDSLTMIIVIGESFIKSHASLYRYPLNTMPFMSEQLEKGNLTVYNDVITTAKVTSTSLRNFFSSNSCGDKELWSEAPFFPAILKVSGYNVFFWDNQYGKNDLSNSDFGLNAYIHNNTLSKISYDMVNERTFRYDGELVENFRDSCFYILNKKENNSLVMFHLMGQHFKAEKRYPNTKEFSLFNADSIHREDAYLTEYKKGEIAKYDNAVLYNDYVLSRIIEMFKDQNAILLFFSDHGELIYDVSDVLGRTLSVEQMSPTEMVHFYDIPMLFWYSNKYKKKHLDVVSLIESNKNKPLQSDNLCQLIFHITGVKSKWYQSNRDILSPDYLCPPRIIEDIFNYDHIRNSSL